MTASPYAIGAMAMVSASRFRQIGARISEQLGHGIAKAKAIPKVAAQWLDDHREEIFAALDKLERLTRHMTSRFLPPAETGALTSAGWTPFAWSLEEITNWGGLALTQGTDATNAAICAAYRAENWARLDHLAKSMYASPLLSRRAQLIRDAVEAHKLGLHAASIPLLIAQLEGATRDAVDQAAAAVVRVEAAHDGNQLVTLADASPRRTSALDSLLRLDPRGLAVFAGQVYSLRLAGLYARYFPPAQPIPPGSRHAILHGADLDYPSEALSLQLLLLLEGLPTAVVAMQLAAVGKALHAGLVAYSEAIARDAAEQDRLTRHRSPRRPATGRRSPPVRPADRRLLTK
jgi:hypothetical protein